jgi:hypothetical protein
VRGGLFCTCGGHDDGVVVGHQPRLPDGALVLGQGDRVQQRRGADPFLAELAELRGGEVLAAFGVGEVVLRVLDGLLRSTDLLDRFCFFTGGDHLLAGGGVAVASVGVAGLLQQPYPPLTEVFDQLVVLLVVEVELTFLGVQPFPQLLRLRALLRERLVVAQLIAFLAQLGQFRLARFPLGRQSPGLAVDLLGPVVALHHTLGAVAVPQVAGVVELLAGRRPAGDAELDDGHLLLPPGEVPLRLLDLDPVAVFGAAQPLFLFQFAVQAGEGGDRVEDPGRGQFVERLGEQVRGGAGPHRGRQERHATHVRAVEGVGEPVGVDVVAAVAFG